MTSPHFRQLNKGWTAEPNVPLPSVVVDGRDILLRFSLNFVPYPEFREDVGIIRFKECSRYRLGVTNDHGWYLGQCRYSKTAPAWGEFYELSGPDPLADQPQDWIDVAYSTPRRHFLFYFRDDTFECFAADWQIEPIAANALAHSVPNV